MTFPANSVSESKHRSLAQHITDTRLLWGCAAGKKWKDVTGTEHVGNLDNKRFLLIVPPTLHAQVATEAKRFLRVGAFDVIPYVSQDTDKNGWELAITNSKQKHIRQIVIATKSVRFRRNLSHRKR